ncbi:MAG TPA: 3-isopropylmalate dehydratase small subunit [Nitrososphaeraceae archaeon]|nr:3-isopropylmalate dehydratase small subunit [Nitrososphaeraceae archaeon]
MTLKGTVHKYDKDNIDTDVILPGPYLKIHDHDELSKHAMEGIDADFSKKVSSGDFLLAGNNFGCGSSREHAPIALSHSGISAVIAPSFARIFYRNCVDGGYLLPLEVQKSTLQQISDKDTLEIDIEENQIRDVTNGKKFSISPFPPLIKKIIDCGGLMYYKE